MTQRFSTRSVRRLALAASAAAACLLAAHGTASPPFDEWSAPVRLDSLPYSSNAINSPGVDGCVSWAKNGLSLYFTSNRTGNFDIYVATRPTVDVGFGHVQRLPAPVSREGSSESCPTIANGNRLFFTGTKDDPAGDLYVTRNGPQGWSEPVNLGPNVNTDGLEESATFYTDAQGREVMLFNRRPQTATGPSGSESVILMSVNGGPAVPLPGPVNEGGNNFRPTLSRDGRTLWFDSSRGGNPDIYTASRSSVSQPFGNVTPMTILNSPALDLRPSISFDGSAMAFSSTRSGSTSPAPDIWYAERKRLRGN